MYRLSQVLQTFATAERPLVICLDDIQWLADELPLYVFPLSPPQRATRPDISPFRPFSWQTLLASTPNRLEHVFIVAGYRTETTQGDDDVRPSDESLLCLSTMIHVPRLARPAIAKYLQGCFHWGDADPKYAYLSTFLASQTSGSPLYLVRPLPLLPSLHSQPVLTHLFSIPAAGEPCVPTSTGSHRHLQLEADAVDVQHRRAAEAHYRHRRLLGSVSSDFCLSLSFADSYLCCTIDSVMRGFEEGTQELLRVRPLDIS